MGTPPVARIASLVQDLPALPAAAQRALALLSDPATEPEQLQEALARDQALALQTLRLANSAFYRRNREISTLSNAVVVLGFRTIQTLLLSCAAQRVIAAAGDLAEQLWGHSFAAAAACREFASELRWGAVEREEAFLAGLFHDLGKGVIASRFPGIYGDTEGAEGERAALGFDHGELGRVLLEQWKIPEALSGAVGTHHGTSPSPLGCLIVAGEWLAWGVADGVGGPPPERPSALLSAYGVGPEGLGEILARVKLALEEESGPHELC
ncbi:MAG: HDOD domain-containing protein [Proteobacteria bacterium]|nr:HDOD domain-containing protein [Pseudomonadota bacterium]